MNKCSILIADDEQLARQAIRLQLETREDLEIMEARDGREALEMIINNRPDIIFLDIRMPMLTGLQVLEKLPDDYFPQTIIVSAYDNYAIDGFEKEAIDYLVKPFTDERFSKSFERAFRAWRNKQLRTGDSTRSLLNDLKHVMELAARTTPVRAITIRDGSRIFLTGYDDILYIEASGDYVTVYTKERKYLHTETLVGLETHLPPNEFVRIHKSIIVNIRHVKELRSHFNGDYTVELDNGTAVKLSRSYREKFLALFK